MSVQGSYDARPKLSHLLKQAQRLIMSPQMQQAIHLLQVPIMEINTMIDLEMEQNPLLEYMSEDADEEAGSEEEESGFEVEEEKEITFDDNDFTLLKQLDEDFRDHWEQSCTAYGVSSQDKDEHQAYIENIKDHSASLFDRLEQQAREFFTDEKKLTLASALIGNIDSAGFLTTELEEIAILNNCTVAELEEILMVIQTFEPVGVAARNVKEQLLLLLRADGKGDSLAYRIINEGFNELLANQIPDLCSKLGCEVDAIYTALDKDICGLSLHSLSSVEEQQMQQIYPDASITIEDNALTVNVSQEHIPSLRLNRKYLRMLEDDNVSKETKDFIKKKVLSAKWLMRNINQRNDTLYKLISYLVDKQKAFFVDKNGALIPLTMKEAADSLEVHESTVARAVSNKYVDTPRGCLPLRYFFSHALSTSDGNEVAATAVKDTLTKLVAEEDKNNPFSDQQLTELLKKRGILCARRTVAKYRQELGLGNQRQRKVYDGKKP